MEAPEVLAWVGVALAGIAVVMLAVRSAIQMFVPPRPAREDRRGSA